MVIGVPKEIIDGEKRVALTPDTAAKLIKAGFTVQVESGAGTEANYTDEMYEHAGVKISGSLKELYSGSDIILKVQRPAFNDKAGMNETELMKPGSVLLCLLYPLNYREALDSCLNKKVSVVSMDFIPRTTLAQKMDALSSQANLSGYKSVLLASNYLQKIFPLMMTAAGTITPSKVVIMGAGVAGLQALGTAKRLGAVVEVSDVRPAVKEEVMSLGGRFIEVEMDKSMQDERGYAKEASQEYLNKQKEVLFKHITAADIVITTALVPGRKAPILVTEEMVKHMRHGSVVLDMAVEFGGNCEISEAGKVVIKHGVTIIGEPNLPSLMAHQASDLYSKNLLAFIQHFSKEGNLNLNPDDEIVKSSLIVKDGELVNERVKNHWNTGV